MWKYLFITFVLWYLFTKLRKLKVVVFKNGDMSSFGQRGRHQQDHSTVREYNQEKKANRRDEDYIDYEEVK